jgi:hypothetical protein
VTGSFTANWVLGKGLLQMGYWEAIDAAIYRHFSRKRRAEIVARTSGLRMIGSAEPVLVPGFVKRPWRDTCILRLTGIESKL